MEIMKEQFIAKFINFIHFNMNVQKKAKICATLVMIFLILLILEPRIFGTCFLFIAMAIGLFIALWLFMYYMFSEYFSYQKIRKKKDEKQQDC